jgi:uncharacterized repeat protein (TIGR01451 family)
MTQVRRLSLAMLVVCLVGSAGCLTKHNREYFPHWGPFGRVVQTHAKPGGPAYFSNFDRHAVKLDVIPLEGSSPVDVDQLVIATVLDEDNKPRRSRRIEWLLEGAGQIIEVDESGWFPGRGGKLDNNWGYSYTDVFKHKLNRRIGGDAECVEIHPGQTWCVIRSSTEGTSHLTVYAPEIANWNNNKVTVRHQWVNAAWTFPAAATVPAGRDIDLVTHLFRPSDRQGLANYLVRYKVQPAPGAPQAVFRPTQSIETTVNSDLDGNAHGILGLAVPQAGTNHVTIEIFRGDPAGGAPMFIARGETTVEWDTARVMLSQTGPPALVANQDNPVSITISNNGKALVHYVTLRQAIPEGLQYVRSDPPALQDNGELVWGINDLDVGKTRAIQVMYRPTRVGSFNVCVSAETDDKYKGEQCLSLSAAAPQLQVSMTAPATGNVGMGINYQVAVTNNGSSAATNVELVDDFDAGLEHESKYPKVKLVVGTLAVGQTKTYELTLKPNRTGRLANRVTATADGGLTDRTERTVDVQDTKLKVSIDGPPSRYAARPVDWTIHVVNSSPGALSNVEVRDVLPPEVSFREASNGGVLSGGQVAWNLGTLQPGQEVQLKVGTRAERAGRTVNKVVASVNREVSVEETAALEVRGASSLGLKVVDLRDPVEVGGATDYRIEVANQGSIDGKAVQIRATLPPELQVLDARGPGTWQRDGQDIVFAPTDGLRPGQTFTYEIHAQATKPGEAIMQVALSANGLPRPVLAQESTRLYSSPGYVPRPGGGPGPNETPEPPVGEALSAISRIAATIR